MAIPIIREVSADVVKRGTTRTVYAKQNDVNSRFLNVHIQEDGREIVVNPALTVILSVKRSDDADGLFYGKVNENGTVQIPLTPWMLALDGALVCDISLVSEDPAIAKLTTMSFTIYVEAAAVTDSDIVDSEEYSVVVDLLSRTTAAAQQAQGAVAAAEAALMKASETCEDILEAKNNGEFNGPKGEPFTYDDLTPEQKNELKGAPGLPGESGVHVGSNAPTGNENVWIDPNGESIETEEWVFTMEDDSTVKRNYLAFDGQAAVLRLKNSAGEWVDIPAIMGKSSYSYAKDGGYTGTEEEFAEDINPNNIKAAVTPVKGTDYFTESDKDDIATRTVMLIKENGVVGFVDEDNNIVLSGKIASGTYTLKYENEDGTYTEIGTLEIGAIPEPEPAFTNFADPTSADFKVGYRLTTNIDQVTALTGGAATNYISVQTGDVVEVSGINFADGNNRQAANGSFGGIAKAEVIKSTYGQYFGNVSYDDNNLKLTILGDMTQMRFSGLLTGTSNDVVVKITRNGTLL